MWTPLSANRTSRNLVVTFSLRTVRGQETSSYPCFWSWQGKGNMRKCKKTIHLVVGRITISPFCLHQKSSIFRHAHAELLLRFPAPSRLECWNNSHAEAVFCTKKLGVGRFLPLVIMNCFFWAMSLLRIILAHEWNLFIIAESILSKESWLMIQWSNKAGFCCFGRIRSFGWTVCRSFCRIPKLR